MQIKSIFYICTHFRIFHVFQTLHVSNQQVALGLLVDPVLESTTFLSCLWVASHQVDLFAVLDWILDKVTNQLLLQSGVRDVVGWTMNQVDGNDPKGSTKEYFTLWMQMCCREFCLWIKFTACYMCDSLWDLSEGFDRLGCSVVRLDVLSCCVLDLALLQSKKSITIQSIQLMYRKPAFVG